MKFIINGNESKIQVEILKRLYPFSTDFRDINVLLCIVNIDIPGYTANFPTCILSYELRTFYSELKSQYESSRGNAKLLTVEGGINMVSIPEEDDRVKWDIEAQYPEGYGATLSFQFYSDKNCLSDLITQLKHILEEYPVRE